MIKQLAILLTICSWLVGCSVPLPDADICVANLAAQHLTCYNLYSDYQPVGNKLQLKPGATPHFKPFSAPSDVDKFTVLDPDSFGKVKAFLQAEQAKCAAQSSSLKAQTK